MEISFDKLHDVIAASGYSVNGSPTEQSHGTILSEDFPNSEIFWKTFIVPFTNRIDETVIDFQQSLHPRSGVCEKLQAIGSFHYSIFHNFIYAHAALVVKQPSFFENFYTHLGTICDCVEEFLIYLYFITLECNGEESKSLQKLSKTEFIEVAEQWYEDNYSTLYLNYLSKGKTTKMTIPTRSYVLTEYFGKFQAWKKYITFSQKIRQYRNVIVHNHTLAFLMDTNGVHYVPKKEKISEYRKWTDNNKAIENPAKFNSDFIVRETLMEQDLKQMKVVLQALWEKPIEDMTNLLFANKNEELLAKYNLRFTEIR